MADRSRYIARVQFLGAQRIEIGNEVVTPDAERLFAMIVRLSVPLGRITSRQTMLDTLWPGSDDANARHNLRQTVYKAREIGLVVESGEDGLRLDPRHWSCDWEDPDGDVGGEWLTDYAPEFSDELGAWVTAQRVGVHAMIRPRIVRALQRARSAGDLIGADRYAVQLLQIDELNEEATLTRAELMAMQGAKVDALRLLDAYLNEIGRLGAGRDAALPAHLLRRRIAEKLPVVSYQNGEKHHGPLVGRAAESKRLLAGLFDARAGRGGAVLLYGREGSGKSRLMFEVKKAAILQGMVVLEMSVESTPNVTPFRAMRRLVSRMLELPGSMGVSPEALEAMRAWMISESSAPDDCPLAEIEDLLAAVSEETPTVLLLDHCERIDAESLLRLDRIYRRGHIRYHCSVLATSAIRTPLDAPIALQGAETLALVPMSLLDTRCMLEAYAKEEFVRASSDQISCAAVFAEGVPMYGIEMLGLILDDGSPDVIPWRVQIALDRALSACTNLQLRLLALCAMLGASARQSIITQALEASSEELACALDGLELAGLLGNENGVLCVSTLLSDAVTKKRKTSIWRGDAARAADAILNERNGPLEPTDFYSCLRVLLEASDELRAQMIFDANVGSMLMRDTSENVVHELTKLMKASRLPSFDALVDETLAQVALGSDSKRATVSERPGRSRPSSLPMVSCASHELELTLSSTRTLSATLSESRDPSAHPAKRLADAVIALIVAFNRNDEDALASAYNSIQAVRDFSGVNPFDVCRAEVVYHSFFGDKENAMRHAIALAAESRMVKNVELACTGLRNAAQAHSAFGDLSNAQSLLLESREMASRLKYFAQIVWADINLAE